MDKTPNKWIRFNDDHSLTGIEGYYFIDTVTVEGKKRLIIYIDPTSNLQDWFINFYFFQRRIYLDGTAVGVNLKEVIDNLKIDIEKEKVLVHGGYYPYAMWALGKFEDLAAECDEVTTIGYSMGGGLAEELGFLLEADKAVNIGGPRVGNEIFYKLYGDKVVKHVNDGDMVPKVPMKIMGFSEPENITVHEGDWKFFWQAHAGYNIREIVQLETGVPFV